MCSFDSGFPKTSQRPPKYEGRIMLSYSIERQVAIFFVLKYLLKIFKDREEIDLDFFNVEEIKENESK
jgi:uncharacterized membrane protein